MVKCSINNGYSLSISAKTDPRVQGLIPYHPTHWNYDEKKIAEIINKI
jgi:hypothetical protein